ncbi:hypothetical protein [Phytohabitans houttuyneae]|uniref:Uncharacterized protein n=1 Tax=Phytohabitans houttuyneae TaxID=1076126 RepID=A0A6V8K137_9ACTN|nr:hypothetical protein [Phytohabitans houttuyneae]GFJ77394.1 hypothetical protein Phou_015740 [Phytohabitans houttuyneae]
MDADDTSELEKKKSDENATPPDYLDLGVLLYRQVRAKLDKEERAHFFSWLLSTPVNLLIVLVSVSASLMVASCSIGAALVPPLVERGENTATKKEQAYSGFTEAVSTARAKNDAAVDQCLGRPTPPAAGKCSPMSELFVAFDQARISLAKLRAYASNDAIRAAEVLIALLPRLIYQDVSGGLRKIDGVAFTKAFDDLLRLMCTDIRADSGKPCG